MSLKRAVYRNYGAGSSHAIVILAVAGVLSISGPVECFAQDSTATPTPAARKPVFGSRTPPGFKGPKVQRGVVTPAVITPRAAATAAPAAQAAMKLPKPVELAVKSKAGQKAVNVTWKSDSRATTLTLERAESENGPFSAVAILASSEGNFDDENSVFPGTTYYYRMLTQFEGYNGALVSPLSSPVQVILDKPEGTSLDSGSTGTGMILPATSDSKSTPSKEGR
ncbi:MAG: hypothetical protein ACR2IE_17240 [Candidatus Sumerlaeaceae bacterium]